MLSPGRPEDGPRTVAIVLPASERFGPATAGAVAMIARRLAAARAAETVVLGRRFAGPVFDDAPFRGIAGAGGFRFNLGVLRALRALRPQFVDIYQQPRLAWLAARFLPQAIVVLVLQNDPLDMRGLKQAVQRARMLRRVDRVICASDWLKRRYETGIGASAKIVVLPNPLTLAGLPSPHATRRPEILFAGRVVADKGVAEFVAACREALPALPGWTARIIGGDRFGPDSPETPFLRTIRRDAEAAGIVFEGARPHARVLEAMAEAAIVAVPSRWSEPFGLTALEAMASGAALITTRMGGLPEVAGAAAAYVEAGDAADLARAIRQLATDATARETLASAGRARAARFDTTAVAVQLDAIRAEALADQPAPAL
jgi:glycosyltransferase involved in cell wall biosynthesis